MVCDSLMQFWGLYCLAVQPTVKQIRKVERPEEISRPRTVCEADDFPGKLLVWIGLIKQKCDTVVLQ